MPTAKTDPAESQFEGGLGREGGNAWIPEKSGETLIGKVLDVSPRWSDWINGFYPALTIEPEGGGEPVVFHAFRTVAMRRVLSLKPQPGETIGIKYHGEVENKDGKTKAIVYTVKVKREGAGAVDLYAGMKSPGGRGAKAEDRIARDTENPDDIPF